MLLNIVSVLLYSPPMTSSYSKTFFILFLLALVAYGQQQDRVAIINTLDNLDSIHFTDLAHLTNRLRETAVNVLPKERYGIMTTESIVAFLGSQENAIRVCKEASCLAEIGRKVNADYVAQARIGRFGGQLAINFELYNSKSGNLIGSFTGFSKDIFGLLAIIDENASALFKKMLITENVVKVAVPAVPQVSEKKIIETETEILVPVESQENKPLENYSYQNFTTTERWKTWALNLTINGLGSWVVMEDGVGGLVHFGLGACTIVAFIINSVEPPNYHEEPLLLNNPDISVYNNDNERVVRGLIYAFLGIGAVWNIYRSATYDKPQSVAHREYGGFDFAILPDRRGGFMPAVVYNRGF